MSKPISVKAALLACATLAAQAIANPATAGGVLDPAPAYQAPYPVPYPTFPTHPGVLDPSPAYALPPVYDWTGLYVGINGGFAASRATWSSDPDGTQGAVSHSSGTIGGTLGYNLETFGQWVIGEEFDFNYRYYNFTIPAATCGPTCTLTSDWYATARLRAGYAIDRFLPYITAGLSMGDLNAYSIGQPNGINQRTSFNFAAGAGLEVAIWGPLSGKIEYLYVNNERIDCIVECNGPVHIRPDDNVVRVGLNYRLWQR
jgi:outer membrane immunogenic protein